MNKIITTAGKVFRFMTFSIVLTAGVSVFATAAEGPVEDHPGSASTAEIRYIGSQEGEPLFNLVYNNTLGSKFSVRILDNEGRQLYQGFYQDKKFNKKFMVTNADGGKIIFVVRNFRDNSVQRFEVNTDTRMVEDLEVKEVK